MALSQERVKQIQDTKISDWNDVEKILQVGEVEDPTWFFGRDALIKQIVDFFAYPEKSTVIFGERGVGKSSLGWFIDSIARADLDALDGYGGRERVEHIKHSIFKPSRVPLKFYPVRVIGEKGAVLDNLYYALSRQIYAAVNNKSKLEQLEVQLGATIPGGAGGQIKVGLQRVGPESVPIDTGGRGWFEKAVKDFETKKTDTTLVVIVDEFDLVVDGHEIISQIKKHPRLKLVLIGIEGQVIDLIKVHASATRELEPLKVEPMNSVEMDDLIKGVVLALNKIVLCAEGFAETLTTISQGSPYLCKSLLRFIIESTVRGLVDLQNPGSPIDITPEHIRTAVKSSPEIFKAYESVLKSITRNDPKLSIEILKKLPIKEFNIEEIESAIASGRIPIEQVHDYLMFLRDANVLIVEPKLFEKTPARFDDPVLQRYVHLRDWFET
jgi:hypothetical protein